MGKLECRLAWPAGLRCHRRYFGLLWRALLSGDLQSAFITLALSLPAIVLCLSVHEAAHGGAAYLLGDRTAHDSGRMTLSPMAHIDPLGFLCLLLLWCVRKHTAGCQIVKSYRFLQTCSYTLCTLRDLRIVESSADIFWIRISTQSSDSPYTECGDCDTHWGIKLKTTLFLN